MVIPYEKSSTHFFSSQGWRPKCTVHCVSCIYWFESQRLQAFRTIFSKKFTCAPFESPHFSTDLTSNAIVGNYKFWDWVVGPDYLQVFGSAWNDEVPCIDPLMDPVSLLHMSHNSRHGEGRKSASCAYMQYALHHCCVIGRFLL